MGSPLAGRAEETKVVSRVLTDAGHGASGVLVLRGDPGIGKTTLLEYAEHYARRMGFLVLRTGGVRGEADLPYAALHQLLRPVGDRMDALPAPRAAALRDVLDLAPPAHEKQPVVGLALLALLAELSRDEPVLCLVDDLQLLDRASAEALLFAARRLRTERLVLLLAERAGEQLCRGAESLPELWLTGMDRVAAETLLARRHPHLSIPARERVIGESGGNPLALVELPVLADRRHTGLMSPIPVTDRVRETLALDQIQRLGEDTRMLLLIAATQDTGDLGVLLAAAELVGVPPTALEAAERAGVLVVTAGGVRFRQRLLRSVTYHDAPFARRSAAHRAVAELLDADEDVDRRAWHLGTAVAGADDDIADALQATAWRAAARHGHAAVALAYRRAADLSTDRGVAVGRLVVAARAALDAGLVSEAAALVARASASTGDVTTRGELAQVRGHVEFTQGSPRTAARLLLADPAAARGVAAAARHAWHAEDPALVTEAVAALDALSPPATMLVTGARALGHLVGGELAEGHALLRDLAGRPEPAEPWQRLSAVELLLVADCPERAGELAGTAVAEFRADGRFGCLAAASHQLTHALVALGEHRDAGSAAEEGLRLAADTGQPPTAAHLRGWLSWLAAVAGDEERCRVNARECLQFAEENGHRMAVQHAVWALALLDLGHGQHQQALDRLETLWQGWSHLAGRCAGDYVEAATLAGRPERAAQVLEWGEQCVETGSERRTAAIMARCRGLLRPDEAERHFTEALRLHRISPQPYELARTRLLYGEWLRRHRRVIEARAQLASALAAFESLGARPWTDRARVELRVAGGAPAPRERPGVAGALTARELQIVRLAAAGATNRDIAAQMQLSPRTVGQHLYKAFPKLGVKSRAELSRLRLDTGAERNSGRRPA